MLTGIFLHDQLAEAFKKFPSEQWVRLAEDAGLGITTVRSPGEALADKSFLADGCVVEVDDPDEGPIHHVGPLAGVLRDARFGGRTRASLRSAHG